MFGRVNDVVEEAGTLGKRSVGWQLFDSRDGADAADLERVAVEAGVEDVAALAVHRCAQHREIYARR